MLKERIEGLKEELETNAGKDSIHDRWVVGVLAGYNDILKITLEEVDNGN
jgi:hypothetical protein